MKKYLKTVLILVYMVLVLTYITACANQENEGNTPAGHTNSKPSIQNEISDEEQLEAAYQEQEIYPQQLKEYYDFISETFRYMLAGTKNNNITYAPISFYVSLSILSEMTDKEAGKELQNALGYADLNKHAIGLQNMVDSLKKPDRYDGLLGRLNLDTSFWLQDTLHYQEAVMDTVQKKYNLEVFKGDFQNSEFQKQMEDWVYEKTNHSLQPQFEDLMAPKEDEDNAFCIINTLDFFGEWSSQFETEDTKKGIFYCEDGTQVKCKFMNQELPYAPYVAGDGYISTELSFLKGGDMIFILPDETQDVHGFWTKDRLADILSVWGKDELSVAKMKFSVPKFNCSGKIDLKVIAEKMQLNQLFNPSSNAFGSFSDDPLHLTGINQETSISINEKGCSLESLTGIVAVGAAPEQPEKIEICLDRPFYYILCKDEIPFLIGIINNPAE